MASWQEATAAYSWPVASRFPKPTSRSLLLHRTNCYGYGNNVLQEVTCRFNDMPACLVFTDLENLNTLAGYLTALEQCGADVCQSHES